MRPWLARRDIARRRVAPASMGPRPCGRGWLPPPPPLPPASTPGFNGATALRPWLGCGMLATSHSRTASMGPRPCGRGWFAIGPVRHHGGKLQWGHGLAAVVGERVGRREGGGDRASMGPRPCGRGWLILTTSSLYERMSFNGATALRPWLAKYVSAEGEAIAGLQWGHGLAAVVGTAVGPQDVKTAKLQWGHGLAAVVGGLVRPQCRQVYRASMGPRPCGRGWNAVRPVAPLPRLLQWGHGLAAVVGATCSGRVGSTSSFNGATALRPWLGLCGGRLGCRYFSFNGATALRPWLDVPRQAQRPSGISFNGATALRPWLVPTTFVHGGFSTLLQWGHGLAAVVGILSTRYIESTY